MRNFNPILLVEDDRVDAMTVQRAFKEINIQNRLDIVNNGEEAIYYLQNMENISPCLVLLDLNMPKMNGLEFLREARQQKLLDTTPVIILTTSTTIQEKKECFKLHIAGYINKPVSFMKFIQTIQIIDNYWTLSELPE